MTHTPEPWEVIAPLKFIAPVIGTQRRGGIAVLRCREDGVLHTTVKLPEANANATRIVACVNGCAGLNPAAFKECVEALKEMLDAHADCKGCTASDKALQALAHATEQT